jgi:hypothetical protein
MAGRSEGVAVPPLPLSAVRLSSLHHQLILILSFNRLLMHLY